MRCIELDEARPPRRLWKQTYYHGTDSMRAAESILRDGLRPNMRTSYRGDLRPAKDRVYLTTDLRLALTHALGPRWMTKNANTFDDDHQYGYVFAVSGRDMTDVDPDEDAIGEFLWLHTSGSPGGDKKPAFDARHDTEPDLRRQIWEFIMQHGKPRDTRESLILGPKRPHAWAALGKTLQPIMPDWMKLKLIQWGAPIAHIGSIRPSQCWRIARHDLAKLDSALTNFFEVAERIR